MDESTDIGSWYLPELAVGCYQPMWNDTILDDQYFGHELKKEFWTWQEYGLDSRQPLRTLLLLRQRNGPLNTWNKTIFHHLPQSFVRFWREKQTSSQIFTDHIRGSDPLLLGKLAPGSSPRSNAGALADLAHCQGLDRSLVMILAPSKVI